MTARVAARRWLIVVAGTLAAACGRMSQEGCVGTTVTSVHNRSSFDIEVLLRSSDVVIGVVPPNARLDFEVPRGTRDVNLRFRRSDGGSRYVPSEMATVSYSCR